MGFPGQEQSMSESCRDGTDSHIVEFSGNHRKDMHVTLSALKTPTYEETINESGFAVLQRVFSTEEVSWLLASLTDPNLARSRAGIRHAMSQPTVREVAHDARLLQIARDVLGTAAFPYRATLFDKSIDSNWLVVWHQDTALPLMEHAEVPGWGPWSTKAGVIYAHAPANALEQILALRVHLDDSGEANGPLRVLPGTHRLGVLADDAIHDLSMRISAGECVVPRGGVLAMRPLLVHSSSKSQVNHRRRVLHIEYAASSILPDGLKLAVT